MRQTTAWDRGLRVGADGKGMGGRRSCPARHLENLIVFEKKTGWKYSVNATNITKMWGIPGSHQAQWVDALHRQPAPRGRRGPGPHQQGHGPA